MAEVLDGDYETAEEAAEVAIGAAWDMYEDRAKYTLVAQRSRLRGEWLNPDDERAEKFAFGNYDTDGRALSAAKSIVTAQKNEEQFRVWIVPFYRADSPAQFHTERAKKRKVEELGRTQSDGLVEELNERMREAAERAVQALEEEEA